MEVKKCVKVVVVKYQISQYNMNVNAQWKNAVVALLNLMKNQNLCHTAVGNR